MDMLSGLGTALIYAMAWGAGLYAGLGLLLLILTPLDIPFAPKPAKKSSDIPIKDEWIIGGFFVVSYLHFIGVLICGALYIGFRIYYRSKHPLEESDEPAEPFFPRFSLAELLAMVVSFGCAPLVFSLLYFVSVTENAPAVLTFAFILFPIAYLRAVQRLNANRVPPGFARSALVFIYPYMIYACLFLCVRSLLMLAFWGSKNVSKDVLGEHLPLRLAIAASIFGVGFAITRAAIAQIPPKDVPVDKPFEQAQA
jgi:hypothetical protein